MWVVPLQLTVQYWWKIKCNTNRIQNSVKGDLDGIDHLIKVKITLRGDKFGALTIDRFNYDRVTAKTVRLSTVLTLFRIVAVMN